jgi:hypothetical protein
MKNSTSLKRNISSKIRRQIALTIIVDAYVIDNVLLKLKMITVNGVDALRKGIV